MSNVFETALAETRGKRQFIARVANELLELSDYNAKTLSSVQWGSFAALPQWCVLDAKAQKHFRDACGAVYLAPKIRKQVDGSKLVMFREAVGAPAFKYLFSDEMKFKDSTSQSDILDAGKSMSQTISMAGTCVILSTLSNPVAEELYTKQYGPPLQRLDAEKSRIICNNAQELLRVTELKSTI